MRLRVTFKTPDAVDRAIRDARVDAVDDTGLEAEVRDTIDKFVRFGEYVTIEFDTTLGTATVLKSEDR